MQEKKHENGLHHPRLDRIGKKTVPSVLSTTESGGIQDLGNSQFPKTDSRLVNNIYHYVFFALEISCVGEMEPKAAASILSIGFSCFSLEKFYLKSNFFKKQNYWKVILQLE